MFLVKLLYAVFWITIGALIIKYRRNVKSWTGDFVWAERYIGRGGTYLVLIFSGVAIIIYGTLYPFGGLEILLK